MDPQYKLNRALEVPCQAWRGTEAAVKQQTLLSPYTQDSSTPSGTQASASQYYSLSSSVKDSVPSGSGSKFFLSSV